MSIFTKHPLVTFTLGVAAGFLIYKYRKEIIEAGTAATEKSREFVLQQRESLGDILAETRDYGQDLPDS